jgi:hypothetical protein
VTSCNSVPTIQTLSLCIPLNVTNLSGTRVGLEAFWNPRRICGVEPNECAESHEKQTRLFPYTFDAISRRARDAVHRRQLCEIHLLHQKPISNSDSRIRTIFTLNCTCSDQQTRNRWTPASQKKILANILNNTFKYN